MRNVVHRRGEDADAPGPELDMYPRGSREVRRLAPTVDGVTHRTPHALRTQIPHAASTQDLHADTGAWSVRRSDYASVGLQAWSGFECASCAAKGASRGSLKRIPSTSANHYAFRRRRTCDVAVSRVVWIMPITTRRTMPDSSARHSALDKYPRRMPEARRRRGNSGRASAPNDTRAPRTPTAQAIR